MFHWVLPEGLGLKTITGAGEVQRLAQKPQQGCGASHFVERSVSDVPRVKAPGKSGVGRALDDGSAIGKQSHFVRFFPELQDEVGMTDATEGLKTLAQVAEINGAMMLVNLYRIASAKRNMRTAGSSQMNKVS